MLEPLIRPRSDGDLSGCVEALATVHRSDRYPARWPADPAGWLSPQHLLGAWVAVDEGAVLGHVALTRADDSLVQVVGAPAEGLAAVARLFVAATARGRGIARVLLETATQAADALGLRAVLEVESGAAGAIGLYERTGWRFVGAAVADWIAPDGQFAVVRAYVSPAKDVVSL